MAQARRRSTGKLRSTLDGELPSSAGEKRILRLAASIGRDIPVGLGKTVTGIDDSNVGLLVKAVIHASGRRKFPR